MLVHHFIITAVENADGTIEFSNDAGEVEAKYDNTAVWDDEANEWLTMSEYASRAEESDKRINTVLDAILDTNMTEDDAWDLVKRLTARFGWDAAYNETVAEAAVAQAERRYDDATPLLWKAVRIANSIFGRSS